ncbi:chromate transporter [Fusobacterium sp. PH5-44]|uniref:chromate transporter n=2 Tax=unclassified Fusobacterium TaxID=2648384 RepID=UPI003D1AD94D
MLYLKLFLSFMKISFFSFGGMTMIPVINDEVLRYGWMTEREVADIVAIAEMTPGSLGINCATFVGLRTAGILGAICASLGAMVPSLTLCLVASYFIKRLKENPALEIIMSSIRPICFGMIISVIATLGKSTYIIDSGFKLNFIIIGIISGIFLIKLKWSIPKTIVLAGFLGILIG